MARRLFLVGAAAAAVLLPVGIADAVPPQPPSVLHVGQVTAQDVPAKNGCENDTVVEPDVAVSPVNRNVAIAAAHDCRYSDGGAVSISVAWTSNGGASWQHHSLAPLDRWLAAQRDPYRASDPAVAFAPDGTA